MYVSRHGRAEPCCAQPHPDLRIFAVQSFLFEAPRMRWGASAKKGRERCGPPLDLAAVVEDPTITCQEVGGWEFGT